MVAGDVLDTPLPPLTWLRAFEAAARHRSFTHAASELHVTPSAVSQHVRSLEGFLGKELFIRGTRSLHLTEGGSNYLPIVRQAFEILAEGTRAFRPGDPGRSLIVQASPAFSTFWLAPRIRGLLTMHPWLHLNLTTPIWDPERSSSDADVEIRFLRANETMDGAVRLTRDRCYPVCRPRIRGRDPRLETRAALRLHGDDAGLGELDRQPGSEPPRGTAHPLRVDVRRCVHRSARRSGGSRWPTTRSAPTSCTPER